MRSKGKVDGEVGGSSHVVYRLYAKRNRLLYIGCTSNFSKRLPQHECKDWGGSIVRYTLTEYPDRQSALAAERAAIRSECPRHNRTSIDPGVFGEGTAQKELRVRNCTILVGMDYYTDRVRVSFHADDGKTFDHALAVKRIVNAAAIIAKKESAEDLGIEW